MNTIKEADNLQDKIFSKIQVFSEKIVDIENQLSSLDLFDDYDNDSIKDYSRICIFTTLKLLKDSHLQLIKLQQNLINPLLCCQNNEENEENLMNSLNTSNLIENPFHEIEHWKLSVHKLLDQIRNERNNYQQYKINIEKENKQLYKDLLNSKETMSHLHGKYQIEKEKVNELEKELNLLKNNKNNKSKNSSSTIPKNTSTSRDKHMPPFHQMSSLSESENSSEKNDESLLLLSTAAAAASSSNLKNLSFNELLFIYHRDIASARAEISVLSQELAACGKREDDLSENVLQLKQKLAALQALTQPHSPHSPMNRTHSRRSMSVSRSYSLSPTPQSATQLLLPYPNSKLNEFYSSEITSLLSELESKHQEEVKDLVGKLHEKLNNLYEENNTIRQQLHQVKQENYKLMKQNKELIHEKTTLETNLGRITKTSEHYRNLYNQLTSSKPTPLPIDQSNNSTSSIPTTLTDSSSSHEELECDYDYLIEKNQLNDKILVLHKEKQTLLNELYELKKKNTELLFQLHLNTSKSKDLRISTEIDSPTMSSYSSNSKRPLRKSMSLM